MDYQKQQLLILSLLLAALVISINIISAEYATIWTAMIIPVTLIIVAYPNWKLIHIMVTTVAVIKYLLVFFVHDAYIADILDRYIVGTIVNVSVVYTFATYRMSVKYKKEEHTNGKI